MKKLIVSAIAAVAMAGVAYPTYAETKPATKHQANMKTATLSDAHKVSYDNVPEKVKDTVKKHLGSTRIEDVDVGTINGKTVYEMAYKRPHETRTYELRVTEEGHLIGVHGD